MPAGEGDLEALHAQLEAWRDSAAAETVLTKRQLRRLGLQAAARVAEAPASPLAVLVELAQNLPSYAPLLSAVHVPKNLTCVGGLCKGCTGPGLCCYAVCLTGRRHPVHQSLTEP